MILNLNTEDLEMFALALTVSGLVANGGSPSAKSLEILVTKRFEFFQLTTAIVELLEEAKSNDSL